jgi:hypothetical protein
VPFLLVIFSLGKQRKVTRPAGAKAFDVVVASKLQSFKAKSMDPCLRGNDEQKQSHWIPASAGMTRRSKVAGSSLQTFVR